ncbi:MAG: hypothetical protein RLY14_2509 [Planctomycetota bacterium]|jgi:hypothetical protein
MTNDANQIEMLVREVMARLAPSLGNVAGANSNTTIPSVPTQIVSEASAASRPKDEIAVMASVVSVGLLQGKLNGIKKVRVRSKAVVTPAARDLLRATRVELVRGESQAQLSNPQSSNTVVVSGSLSAPVSSVAALSVLCPKVWMERLQKSLCPKRGSLDEIAAMMPEIIAQVQKKFSQGHRLAVLVTESSFDAVVQLARAGIRAVRVASWGDLQLALSEAGPQVWVLDPRQWNIPLTLNACNRVYDSGYWRQRMETV